MRREARHVRLTDQTLYDISRLPLSRTLGFFRDLKLQGAKAQIAELLGCEVGTVKVRVHRAMRELREVFFKLSGEKASWNAKKSETSLRII